MEGTGQDMDTAEVSMSVLRAEMALDALPANTCHGMKCSVFQIEESTINQLVRSASASRAGSLPALGFYLFPVSLS